MYGKQNIGIKNSYKFSFLNISLTLKKKRSEPYLTFIAKRGNFSSFELGKSKVQLIFKVQ